LGLSIELVHGPTRSEALIKAFVLCDKINDADGETKQKDLSGAGLAMIRALAPYPFKHTFWMNVELTDSKQSEILRLSIMRADSGRRLFYRAISVWISNPIHLNRGCQSSFRLHLPSRQRVPHRALV
jgi:hypothetical protein